MQFLKCLLAPQYEKHREFFYYFHLFVEVIKMDSRIQKNINQIYGDFKVIEYTGNKIYLCECIHCGYQRTYNSQAITQAKKKDTAMRCGCIKSGIKKGDKFGRLTAIERDLDRAGQGRVYWKFLCDCGNIVSHSSHVLKSGNTKSCGCLGLETSIKKMDAIHSKYEDLTGNKFELLTVLRQATPEEYAHRPKKCRYWYCLCECGNSHIASTSDLKQGKVKSCGCLNSLGEQRITKILSENGYNFAKQFYFEDLKSSEGRKYYFDFGILNKNNQLEYLIEFDGIQHFSENHQFGQDKETTFENIKRRDETKNNYCFSNNIPLIRIPYYKLDTLKLKDLEITTTDFIVKRSDV